MEKYKEEQIKSSLKRSVELYMAERFDETGFCFVQDVTLSNDHKRATVIIKFSQNPEKDFRIDRLEVARNLKKIIKLRYLPKIEFVKIFDA